MGIIKKRLQALEESFAEAERRAVASTSPWERAFRDAMEKALPEELEELEHLSGARGERQGQSFDAVEDARILELWETMLGRVSSGWANEFRPRRDVLCRDLDRLEEAWTSAGRKHSTWGSDPEYWKVVNAAINRRHAVEHFGAPLILAPVEAARIVALVRSPETIGTEVVMRLVGRV